jgi:flagellar basal-body rod protein FlgG
VGSDLYLSASGAIARLQDLEVVANNLANVDTAGFKRDEPVFRSVLEAALRAPDGEETTGAAGQAYVDTHAVSTNYSAGPVSTTGAPLDAAIDGDGFFEIQTPDGLRYTRAGSFLITRDQEVSTPNGFPVMGEGGAITVGSRPVQIQPSGDIVDDAGEVLGTLKIVNFERLDQLRKTGFNLFEAPIEAGIGAPDEVRLTPGSVERSNVIPVQELAAMVIIQRLFDISMQAIQKDDSTTQQLLKEFLG